jgi:hypothetical protein
MARSVGLVVPVACVRVVIVLPPFTSRPEKVSGLICAPKFHVYGVTAAYPADGK